MLNALSVDVEEHFQVSAFARTVDPQQWRSFESRVVRNTEEVLGILSEWDVKATFFFLGCVAEEHPALVRTVHAEGHEVASHGYDHQLVSRQRPHGFVSDVRRSFVLLENLTGEKILGYRAPSYSITPRSAWALDLLQDQGLLYDSSVFPIYHDLGGFPDSPRYPYQIHDDLWEFPLTTCRVWRWNLPVGGGGYLRLYPYPVTRWAIRRVNSEGIPVMVYVHPWEFDPTQPRIHGAPLLSMFRHYQNLDKTTERLKSLCSDFEFAPIKTVLAAWIAQHRRNGRADND